MISTSLSSSLGRMGAAAIEIARRDLVRRMMSAGEMELQNEEFIHFYLTEVLLELDYSDRREAIATGELFITSHRVHFRTSSLTQELAYAQIAMHGLSSNPDNFSGACVLIQLISEDEDADTPKWLLKPTDLSQCKH